MRTLTRTLALAIALLLPAGVMAQIYLGPEDVLYLNAQQSQRVNRRNAPQIVEARERQIQATTSDDRPTLTEWWTVSSSSAASVQGAAGTQSSTAGTAAEPVDTPLHSGAESMDRITLRLLERLEGKGGYKDVIPVYVPGYKPTQLYHTGPESIIALAVMIPSALFVIRRARKMEKFVRD